MRTATWYAIQRSSITAPVPMDTCRWLDKETMRERFTIRAKVDRKWAHLAEGNELVFFDDEDAARREIFRLRGSARAKPSRRPARKQAAIAPAESFPLRVVQHRLEG